VGTTNVTVRFSEEELRRLDELAQRMGVTRSDVIRSLINNFDEALRQEVEKERKRWVFIGFTAALEEVILDPTLILRFVRRNVDVLGYPDFLIGMIRVRNRVLLFSHHDRIGNQLLQQVRAKVEEEVRKEEEEIEREGGEDEDTDSAGASKMPVVIRRGAHQRTPRAIPETIKYKLVTSGRAAPPIARPTATSAADKPVNNNGEGSYKSTVATSMPGNQKLAVARLLNAGNLAGSQTRGSGPQTSNSSSNPIPAGPVGQESMDRRGGDFIIALITQSYHKHRDRLLKLMESIVGG
jgi:hypothetical protein